MVRLRPRFGAAIPIHFLSPVGGRGEGEGIERKRRDRAMNRILTGVVAGLIGLAFSTTTFGQGAPAAPPMPPGAMEKGEEMKERAGKRGEEMRERGEKRTERMKERAEKMEERAEKMKERSEKMKERAEKMKEQAAKHEERMKERAAETATGK